ncbi:hypothetical protein ES332_A10G147200v1 [Gossypium tomentosum]|uniref:Uncharacterized protein n=1 Tax=Gossypium tomentosum TaxID=34277 RepID=A0A5D2NT34_GOSTO|nr:hypothetical protein ES332_A10G147200v1 [Gossypium tomentosum]
MKDIWNLQPRTRIIVEANQYGQPIGKESSKLAEFLSTIARTSSICPLNTKHWKHLSKYVLENILRIVHEKFDLQGKVKDSDILSHVGKLRKEFKSTSKTRYYKEMVQEGRPIEEIYENNPPSVHDDQWKWLVSDGEHHKLWHIQKRQKNLEQRCVMHILLVVQDMQPSMHSFLRRKAVNPSVWSSLDFNICAKMGVAN